MLCFHDENDTLSTEECVTSVIYSGVVDGVSVSAKTTFKVIRPEVHIKTTTDKVYVDSAYGSPGIHYGNQEIPGISFNSTLEGQAVSSIPGGVFQWVQKVDILRKFQRTDSTGKEVVGSNVLDSLYPYPSAPGYAEDTPGQGLFDTYTTTIIGDKYTMWLLFKPEGDSIPVPLRKVSWVWNSEARRLPLIGWILWSDNHDVNPSDVDATDLPQWSGNTEQFRPLLEK